jgi:hypothetical protein
MAHIVSASKAVKIGFISSDLKKLAIFFGEFQSFGFLFPILISYLNYNDSELKGNFFRNIGGICCVAGEKCVRMILPCILLEIYGM